MSKQITLASGQITPSPRNTITVELVEPTHGKPATVTITWPTRPTVTTPAALAVLVATATRVPSNAVLELARLRNGNS